MQNSNFSVWWENKQRKDRFVMAENEKHLKEIQKLRTAAHLFIWDEPLNYIDIFSRMQIEKLLLAYQPTMLFVEHDVRFCKKIATKTIGL